MVHCPTLNFEPITTPPLYETFTYHNATSLVLSEHLHTFTWTEETICDILIVGGGGAGDRQVGGGGGVGGALLYAMNVTIPAGTYTIK